MKYCTIVAILVAAGSAIDTDIDSLLAGRSINHLVIRSATSKGADIWPIILRRGSQTTSGVKGGNSRPSSPQQTRPKPVNEKTQQGMTTGPSRQSKSPQRLQSDVAQVPPKKPLVSGQNEGKGVINPGTVPQLIPKYNRAGGGPQAGQRLASPANQRTPHRPHSPNIPGTPGPRTPSSPDQSLSHGQGSTLSPDTRLISPATTKTPANSRQNSFTSSGGGTPTSARSGSPGGRLPLSWNAMDTSPIGAGRLTNAATASRRLSFQPTERHSPGQSFLNTPVRQRPIAQGAGDRNLDSFAITSATLSPDRRTPSPRTTPAWARSGAQLPFGRNANRIDHLATYPSPSSGDQPRASLANTQNLYRISGGSERTELVSPFSTASDIVPILGASHSDIQLTSRRSGSGGSRRTSGGSLGSYELLSTDQGRAFNGGKATGPQRIHSKIAEKAKIAGAFAHDKPAEAMRMAGAAVGQGLTSAAFPLLATGNGIAGATTGAVGAGINYVSGNEKVVAGIENWQRQQGRVPPK